MTLAELRAAIQNKGYGTDTATQQTGALNSVYRRINGLRRWSYLERRTTALAATAGQASVSLVTLAPLMWVDAVRIEFGTEYDELAYTPVQDFRDYAHADRDTGRPVRWTEAAGELHLWPKPERAYTLTIDYLTTPADLSADGDIPVFDSTYHDVLVWGAVAEMAYRQREYTAAAHATNEYRERLAEMTRGYGITQRQTPLEVGRVV